MEKGVLGKTRKYIKGSIHENASGQFMILDRYLGNDNKPWLKYQWLSGVNEGKIEENKEENTNASLYKFKVSRGIKDTIEMTAQEVITPNQIFQLVQEIHEIVTSFNDERRELVKRINDLEGELKEHNTLMDKLLMMSDTTQKTLSLLMERNNFVNKLIDKM